MKQKGKEIVGDDIKVDSYTHDWIQVRIHPGIFYRRYDDFINSLKTVKGLYAEIDQGQYVSVRFSDKNDVTEFYRIHHEYL